MLHNYEIHLTLIPNHCQTIAALPVMSCNSNYHSPIQKKTKNQT